MNRRAIAFAILGVVFLYLAAAEFFGFIHGGDMCWLGNGEPFNGQPCPKNFVADPFVMFFANLRVHLVDFQAYSPWGSPLYAAMNLVTLIVSLAFFFLAAHELDRAKLEGINQNGAGPSSNTIKTARPNPADSASSHSDRLGFSPLPLSALEDGDVAVT